MRWGSGYLGAASCGTGGVRRKSVAQAGVPGRRTGLKTPPTAAQDRLGRELNPSVYPTGEFRSKVASGHHFLRSVMSEPKIFLIGDKDELGKLAQ
jgi:hypothetical protein